MPIYEYECCDCSEKLTERGNYDDPTTRICHSCQGHMKRILSKIGGFKFIGPGFYENDYKRKGK